MTISAALTFLSTASATVLPGTMIEYFVQKDAITDENTSTLFVREVNDTGGNNVVMFKCAAGQPAFYLLNKSPLLTQEDSSNGITPNLIYRVDSQNPKTLTTTGATRGGQPVLEALTLMPGGDATLFTAFKNAQSKVVIRVLRRGMSELTFTFRTKGFNQAVKLIDSCA